MKEAADYWRLAEARLGKTLTPCEDAATQKKAIEDAASALTQNFPEQVALFDFCWEWLTCVAEAMVAKDMTPFRKAETSLLYAAAQLTSSIRVLWQFVTGEDFQYLGRHYRLLLVDEQSAAVKLEAGRFKLRKSVSHDGKKHMKAWYSNRGQSWLRRRVQGLSQRVGVEAEINVRDLGDRWGSCTAQGEVKIHWRTMLLPPTVIDYILMHELVHIHEPHHGPEFWTRVERAMPDFARRKQWLAENGGHVGAGL